MLFVMSFGTMVSGNAKLLNYVELSKDDWAGACFIMEVYHLHMHGFRSCQLKYLGDLGKCKYKFKYKKMGKETQF